MGNSSKKNKKNYIQHNFSNTRRNIDLEELEKEFYKSSSSNDEEESGLNNNYSYIKSNNEAQKSNKDNSVKKVSKKGDANMNLVANSTKRSKKKSSSSKGSFIPVNHERSSESKVVSNVVHTNNMKSRPKGNKTSKRKKLMFPEKEKFLDGFTYKNINDKTEHFIYFMHIDVTLKNSIDYDIEVFDIYRPSNPGYKLIKYDYDNDDNLKYFSVVPFYLHKKMKTIIFGIRDPLNPLRKIPGLHFKNNINYIKGLLVSGKPEQPINIFKPKCKDELNYLRQISLINPKNYEYSYDYLLELTDQKTNNYLVDIIVKTGFNKFTNLIVDILRSRNCSIIDISKHIDSKYSIGSKEYKNAPKLINKLNKKIKKSNKKKEENYKEQDTYFEKKEFLCDEKYLYSIIDEDDNNIDIISKTKDIFDKNNNDILDFINEKFCKERIDEYNNSPEGQKRKLNLVLTKETIEKIKLISLGIICNIPMIIQGFTSAGKSFTSVVSSVILRGHYPITTVLSEDTSVEDLQGKQVLQTNDSSLMSFVPGVLLTAYTEGKILIMDECDLAKPDVLSCILDSLSNDEITVKNKVYKKMKGYNVILTMNGEAKGFTTKQRNELTENILTKFVIVNFNEMSINECKNILSELIKYSNINEKFIPEFVNLHNKMLNHKHETVDPIVTLRNLKNCVYLSKVKVPLRFTAEISYTARFPKKERDQFDNQLKAFGDDNITCEIKDNLIKKFEINNLYYDDSYIKCVYLALAACKAGLHPLLIGKSGTGLTELAKFVASYYTNNTDIFLRDEPRQNIEIVQLGSETSVEDLLGYYQQSVSTNNTKNDNINQNIKLSEIISWVDGPIIRGIKEGNSVILDGINAVKSQVIECLNPILENNSIFNTGQYNLIEKDNKELININKGFVVVATMTLGNEMISKALMNRFVSIYLDDFLLNSEAIEKISELTFNKLNVNLENNKKLEKLYSENSSYPPRSPSFSNENENDNDNFIDNNYNEEEDDDDDEESYYEDDNEEESYSEDDDEEESYSEDGDEEEESYSEDDDYSIDENLFDNNSNSCDQNELSSEEKCDDISSKLQNNSNDILETKSGIPQWYNISNFEKVNISDIKNYLRKNYLEKNLKFENIKSLSKTITKLCLIIQRTNLNVSDSYALLQLNDDIFKIKDINNLLQQMLQKDTNNENQFFFSNEEKGNAKKMIISLFSCDLSRTPIFLQGSPGVGKTVASKHYGIFRNFQNRDPILSINCNSDISFEQFVGSYRFNNTSFEFVEGPLILAMKNGEPILVDEFNLCPDDVLNNLIPLLKANENDYIRLKGVPYEVQIKPGFLFIATGNNDNESGRKKLPKLIKDELKVVKIPDPSLDEFKLLLDEILNNEYKEITKTIKEITPDKICDIIDAVKTIAQQHFSLRQIKCLLNRINRFCLRELGSIELNEGEFEVIPVAYVIISYIIPGLKKGPDTIKKLVEKIGDITNASSNDLMEFLKSDVIWVKRSINNRKISRKCIKKDKIVLSTSFKKNDFDDFPPIMKQTYFWIRMSCSLDSDSPSHEPLLLEGPTSYKSYILEKWLETSIGENSYEEHIVNKNTESQGLIGLSTLDDKDKLTNKINILIDNILKSLNTENKYFRVEREEKLSFIRKELNIKDKNITQKNNLFINDKKSLEYIYRCIIELIELEKNYEKTEGIKTMTLFNLGIVSNACIFGKRLIIRGIENISPSVIERINSVIENPRNLVLTEDSQGIFNNQKIFNDLYNNKKRKKGSIPISDEFSIYFTSKDSFNGKLSEAFKSRCTIINIPTYNNKLYLGRKINIIENYEKIAKSIIKNNSELYNELIALYEKFHPHYQIPILSFIRWCNTTKRISEHIQYKNNKYIVGISALRSIIDGFEYSKRIDIINQFLTDEYLPRDLYNLFNKQNNNDSLDVIYDSPFILEKEKDDVIYIKSIASKIRIQVDKDKQNINRLKDNDISWTKSAVDIADAILTSLAARTMLILEGPCGRGKTAISMAVFESLGIDFKRINLSPSTNEEDIFERTIPKVTNQNNIKTESIKGPLYQILNGSSKSSEYFRYGLILDEINLASNDLLEQLYLYLYKIFYKDVYYTSDGETIKIGHIGCIGTMNEAKLSKDRNTLSYTFINMCHTLKLSNYEKEEIIELSENILGTVKMFQSNKENITQAIKCFFSSQKYLTNNSENEGPSLREIFKLKEFAIKCPDLPLDTLIDLVFCKNMSEENELEFKKENHITNTLSNIIPEIKNNKLCFKDLISFDLYRSKHDGQINKIFTSPQKDAIIKIIIGLTAKTPILLFGDIGTGKTHIIKSLADITGFKLNIIQFNSETSSSDIIGSFELSRDSNEIEKIRKEINKLKDLLINNEWSRVTSFIKLIEEGNINYHELKNFFKKLLKDNPLKNKETIEQLKKCSKKLKDFSQLSYTSFEFKKSILITAMEKGEWVLLDATDSAPQEIERLMSLLEENPSLTLYEQNPPIFYSKQNLDNSKKINENFRLIIITSNESVISPAIKSRCLCVKLKNFDEAQHYAELIASCLSILNISDNKINSIASHFGNAFDEMKKEEKENDYILKNYSLTPVNVVNFSKILINLPENISKYLINTPDNLSKINNNRSENFINAISEGMNFSTLSMFKNQAYHVKKIKDSLSSQININISTSNSNMKNKKYILCNIECRILEYAKQLLKSKERNNKEINNNINDSLNEVFNNIYHTKRKASIISIRDENINNIMMCINDSRSKVTLNLEHFTLADIDEYQIYIKEVLCILKKLIPEDEKIYSNLYYLEYLDLLFKDLNLINNEKIKGLQFNTIKNSKEYFIKFGDSEDDADNNSKRIYWFRNILKGFNYLIPKNIQKKDISMTIISMYYVYYLDKYELLDNEIKKNISKSVYIYYKMLEHLELRQILKKCEFNVFEDNNLYLKIFNMLINYNGSISTSITELENGELTIELGKIITIKFNDKKYILNEVEKIEKLREILHIERKNNSKKIKIDNNFNASQYLDYIIPKCLINEDVIDWGNVFWFYNLMNKKYLSDIIINNKILLDFNNAIECLLKINVNNLQNNESIWTNELETIIRKGYQLIYSLKNLRNCLYDNINRDIKIEKINEFISVIINNEVNSNIFIGCQKWNEKLETIINLINTIRRFFGKYNIYIWENMKLLIDTLTKYINEKILNEKYQKEKIKYAKQLKDLKNKLNEIPEKRNKNNIIIKSYLIEIENLTEELNDINNEDINNKIIELEKMVSMIIIASEYKVQKFKKSEILSLYNRRSNYLDEYSKILKKFSDLNGIIDKLKTIQNQQLFINNIYNYSDISQLENFIDAYKDQFILECQNGDAVSENFIMELKHITNLVLILDIIKLNYSKFIEFIENILNNDMETISSIGNYFGDNDYIYLPKFDITDLRFCVQYKLHFSPLIKTINNGNTVTRDPNPDETINDYLKYLIYYFDKKIDKDKDINEIIKDIECSKVTLSLKDTVNNLKNAATIINLFQNISYNYSYDWLKIDNVYMMKENYWKEPGKIIVKYKYSSILQFNEEELLNKEKIVAKVLYANHEANISKEIQCKSNYLKELLMNVLEDIYNLDNKIPFGYRTISFFDRNIYRDNESETMITLLYSIFNTLEMSLNSDILILQNNTIKKIIKDIINKFILDCIENEVLNFNISYISNIIHILLSIIFNEYSSKYNIKKKSIENNIDNIIRTFTEKISFIEKKISNILKEKQQQYINEKEDYKKEIEYYKTDYISKYNKFNNEYYIDDYMNNYNEYNNEYFNDDYMNNYNEYNNEYFNDDYMNNYYEYNNEYSNDNYINNYIYDIEKYTEEEFEDYLKKLYQCNKNKPKDEKNDIKLEILEEKCKNLKEIQNMYNDIINLINNNNIRRVNEIHISMYNNIENMIRDNDIKDFISQYLVYETEDYYKEIINNLLNMLESYFNLIKKNIELKNLKTIEIPDEFKRYKINEDVKTLVKWMDQLFKCKIDFKIEEFNENFDNNNEINISETSNKYSTNTNWIFSNENKPSFLLNEFNIDLGIYVLNNINNNNIGSISIENSCSYCIKYELLQDNSNEIMAYSTTTNNLILQKNEPLNIKFRLNKSLKEKGTLKSEFTIKIINNSNNEFDECKITVYLNVIPLCIKFKLSENYNKNDNVSFNHYFNSLKIEHQFPGNYSSKNLGIIIKSDEFNKYNKINIQQKPGKITSNLETLTHKLQCSNYINIKLNNLYLMQLNYKFITPSMYGLIIYDEKEKNIKSIEIAKGETKSFYLFNMSFSSIDISYKYNKNKIKLSGEILNIKPGEKKKLELQFINNIFSEELKINEKTIIINKLTLPNINIYSKYIELNNPNNYNNYKDNFKLIIIDDKYYINKEILSNKYRLSLDNDIKSCYLMYNGKITSNKIVEYNFIGCSQNDDVYGFKNYEFEFNSSYKNVDIILKLKKHIKYKYWESEDFGHIFKNDKIKKFESILQDNEFKNNLQSDDLNNISLAINKLLKCTFQFSSETIKEDINNLEISKEKSSIKNIIKYLMKLSIKYDSVDKFRNYLKIILKVLYKRKIFIPYFEVSDNLDDEIKIFMKKLSYIISFVEIVVNPGILSNNVIEYINNASKNELSSENHEFMTECFNKCFAKGLKTDKKSSELIYYENKLLEYNKDNKDDIYNQLTTQIENSKIYNNNYQQEKIDNFVQTYKSNIQNILAKINGNKVNITNLYNILDDCISIVTKIQLILSTANNNEDLSFCISSCQKIYEYVVFLCKSSIMHYYFSERIISSYNEIQAILSKFKYFKLKYLNFDNSNNSENLNRASVEMTKSLVKCELPYDNSYENNMNNNKKIFDNENPVIVHFNKSNPKIEISHYQQRKMNNSKIDYSSNIQININRSNDNIPNKKEEEKSEIKFVKVKVFTEEERKNLLSIPYLNDTKEQNININKEDINNPVLDSTDYDNMVREKTVSINELRLKLDNTTPTKFLEMVKNTLDFKNQTLYKIRSSNLIREGLSEDKIFKYKDECSHASSFIQSTISNIIKSNLKFIDNSKILPNRIFNSFIDITVDITHMSITQRTAALIIATGLALPLTSYGVNIRLSVFGERNGVWLLSDDFSTNIETQLARLRDALACKKRYISFPGDALYSLKEDWNKRFYQNQTKYTSVLISSLISSHAISNQIDWNKISNKIIVFGLKSQFEEKFTKEHNIYDDLLKMRPTNKDQIVQRFLDPLEVICQEPSVRKPIEELCNSIVMSSIYKSNDTDNFKIHKIITNDTSNINSSTISNEELPLSIINDFINNNMADKLYYGQNIPHLKTEICNINEKFDIPKIDLPSDKELNQIIQLPDKGSVGSLKNTTEFLLKSQYNLVFPPNSASTWVPSSSGGKISVPALKKWIVSGFTYKDIFLKKSGKTKRKYSITVAIDFSVSNLLSCNYSHAIATTILLLLAPSTLQDNEEIELDVVISTVNGPKIMNISSKANTFESISCINSIINIINNETPKYCTPGNTLNAAYQLQLRRGGTEIGRNIFFITDGYVTSMKEILFANWIIGKCEEAAIDLVTVGVGSYPYGIKELYPKYCYAPSLRVLGDAITFIFSLSNDPTNQEIQPQVIIDETSKETINKLENMMKQPPENKILQNSIENKSMDFTELIGNPEIFNLEGITATDDNPTIEAYHDGAFKGFEILIVFLYLGGYEYGGKIRDINVTKEVFESGAGEALKRKGFKYKMVCSYGEAINELTKSDRGRCPYVETWIFSSSGDGSLPADATDKDTNKIIPFLKCIADFNNNGGGLLLFTDNDPYTFEVNLLLKDYLKFDEKPKFEMKGNYNEPDFEKKYIKSMDESNSVGNGKNGKFRNEIKLPSPGKSQIRYSPRAGLIIFSEGISLSWAQCFDGKSKDYYPFIPFAYTTDKSNENPFILYYDPKMNESDVNQGPIVLHGGYTSAFYDFSLKGTGRLVTSIACWLVRLEERKYRYIISEDNMLIKDIPYIPMPSYNGEQFTKWIKTRNTSSHYSILILDVSGSMTSYYQKLIDMANKIIVNQNKNPQNKITVIFFGSYAKTITKESNKTLVYNDILLANVGKGTNFTIAFQETIKNIYPTGNYNDKRLLFLTDGQSQTNDYPPLCEQISNTGFSIHIIGFGNDFDHLKSLVNGNGSFQVCDNFEDVETSAIKIFTAE